VISDDHEGIKAVVAGELSGLNGSGAWCISSATCSLACRRSHGEVVEDLKAIFKVRRQKTALVLAEEEFVDLHRKLFPKAISVFEAGIGGALSYLNFPGIHHARIRSTNMLEHLFEEVKTRTRVVGVFPNERSASILATEVALRSSEEWALKRYLAMDALKGTEKPNPQLSRH